MLDFLLPEMENRRGKLVVVLAGYKKQMEELMSHNEGLPSRFVQVLGGAGDRTETPLVIGFTFPATLPHVSPKPSPTPSFPTPLLSPLPLSQLFTFTDYSDTELCTIFTDLVNNDKEPRFKIAVPRYLRIATRRLGAQRGMTGFGNARAVRNAYEQAQRRQSARVLSERAAGLKPDSLLIVRDDLLGPRYLDVSTCTALRELEAMRGLAAVKQQVRTAAFPEWKSPCELCEVRRRILRVRRCSVHEMRVPPAAHTRSAATNTTAAGSAGLCLMSVSASVSFIRLHWVCVRRASQPSFKAAPRTTSPGSQPAGPYPH